jgi:flagellar motor component MotA
MNIITKKIGVIEALDSRQSQESRIYVCVGMAQDLVGTFIGIMIFFYKIHRNNDTIACH